MKKKKVIATWGGQRRGPLGPKRHVFKLYIEPEILAQAKDAAKKDKKTVSWWLCDLIVAATAKGKKA